jgi:hypothetical protein
MNRVALHNEPYRDDAGRRTFGLMGSARLLACAVVILMATSAPAALADAPVYGYVGPMGLVSGKQIGVTSYTRMSSPTP